VSLVEASFARFVARQNKARIIDLHSVPSCLSSLARLESVQTVFSVALAPATVKRWNRLRGRRNSGNQGGQQDLAKTPIELVWSS